MNSIVWMITILLMSVLVLGCTDKTVDKINEKPVGVISTTIPIKEDVPVYNNSEGTFTHTFKVNDEDMMFDVNVQLLGFSNEDSVALIMINNNPYQISYNTEKMIKDYIINVTDVNNTAQSVKIIVRQIK